MVKTPLEALGLPDPLGKAVLRMSQVLVPQGLPVDLPLEVSPVKTVSLPSTPEAEEGEKTQEGKQDRDIPREVR